MNFLVALTIVASIVASPTAAPLHVASIGRQPSLWSVSPSERRPLAAPLRHGATPWARPSLLAREAARALPKKPPIAAQVATETTALVRPGADALDFCKGDENSKCNYDLDHRICAQFLDTEGKPLNWGDHGNIENLMPQITDVSADFHWNGGESTCINLGVTARLVQMVGCENVHINCDATDLDFEEWGPWNWWAYARWGQSVAPAVNCLHRICYLEEVIAHTTKTFAGNPADALSVRDAQALDLAYKQCEDVTKTFSKTFYLGTVFMREATRKHAWAIYAWCRRLDDIVDAPQAQLNPSLLDRELEDWNVRLNAIWKQTPMDIYDLAMADTVRTYPNLDIRPFRDMIDGMIMDVPGHAKGKNRYENFDELYIYCYRVASTVGLMVLPILGTADGVTQEEATPPAIALGIALQLTNILRDVGEDLRRGRIYLPLDELRQFGLTEDDLFACQVTEKYKKFIKFQIARARDYYKQASYGIPMLAPESRFAVRASLDLYSRILDKIEENDYDNFNKRAYTTGVEKLFIAGWGRHDLAVSDILPSTWKRTTQKQTTLEESERWSCTPHFWILVVGVALGASGCTTVGLRKPRAAVETMLG